MKRLRSRRRATALAVSVSMLASVGIAACGSSSGGGAGQASLTWFINPDGGGSNPKGGGQAQLAAECSTSKYKINIQLLPNSASDQQTQLLRRLAAGDSSVDLMSVDPAYVTQFAAANYFAPVPAAMVKQIKSGGTVQSSVTASTYNGKIIAVPFWANTQVLWYRKSVAKKAGLDMSKPVTWDQIIAAAQKTHTDIGVQAALYEGYSVWINALVAGAGGSIVDNPNADYQHIKMGLNSAAGRTAAQIIRKVSDTGVGGPALSSSEETQALNLFQAASSSGFLVNWPYVWAALNTPPKVPWINDVGWTEYPESVAGQPARPPFGGIELAVGRSSAHVGLAYQAAQCITSPSHQAQYMIGTGNPAAAKSVYNEPAIKKAFPGGLAALIVQSLDKAATRPLSPYWGDISTALQQRFSPPNNVTSKTPATTQQFVLKVLNGKALL
ncbi:extracellular solute-binding protein [Leekyejoonella antrihumi]|uniref:Extracellular solute-binding protein n=2 Tax=Leekyejoonella antrihumi TaxID=1660198 RepID=A0A563E4W8_9MICO|nr:extracellular solute-binding protein [Leekyejoonella antrihumi]